MRFARLEAARNWRFEVTFELPFETRRPGMFETRETPWKRLETPFETSSCPSSKRANRASICTVAFRGPWLAWMNRRTPRQRVAADSFQSAACGAANQQESH
jgi:hypothetical protein